MAKTWKGYAAAALTASLMMGMVGPSYAGTLTLAGFGADQKVEESKVEAPKAEETSKKEEAPETEAASKKEEAPETEAASQKEEAPKAEEASEKEAAQTEAQTETQTEAQTEPPVDRSMVDTTGFAKTDDYINVRVSGDTEGEVVGTLRANDSVYIEDVDENGWYKVRSGNVEGYVAGYLIATGEEAEEVAQEAAYTHAMVGAESLNVRADASEDSEVVDMVGQDADLEVVEDLGDWVKVVTNDGVYGYVAADYVSTETVYPTGETVQEQSEREEQEYLEAVAQQEAEYAAYVAQQEAEYAEYLAQQEAAGYTDTSAETGYTDTSAETGYTDTAAETTYTDPAAETTYTDPAAESYSTDAAVSASSGDVDALYQAYLEAQDAAMTATDEQDATTKANAAIDAYNAYLAACGSTETVASVEAAPAAEDTTVTDTTVEDTTYTEPAAEETYQEEAVQEEAPAESSGSSTGEAVASYATQFVGNPYVYGGASLTGGADCSGFTMAVYANFGVSLPHNAAAQSGCGTPVSLSDLQPGDLLFYDNGGGIGHVALYIGGGSVVHASNPETGIKISAYNYRSPVAAVRLV